MAEWPRASMNQPEVDDDLWIGVGEDPLEYILELRKQGRVGPQQGQTIAVKLPSTVPTSQVMPT